MAKNADAIKKAFYKEFIKELDKNKLSYVIYEKEGFFEVSVSPKGTRKRQYTVVPYSDVNTTEKLKIKINYLISTVSSV